MATRLRVPSEQGALFELPLRVFDFSEPPVPETADTRHDRLSDRADSLELTGLSRPQAELCAGLVALEASVATHGVFRRRAACRPVARRRVGPDPEYRLPDEQWNLR